MPVYDTPITTDQSSLERVLNAGLPVVLYLYRDTTAPLDEALRRVAKENAGDILVTRIDVNANPDALARFGNLKLPALVTLDEGEVESKAGDIRPADVDEHVDFLMGRGPMPTETVAEAETRQASGGAPVHVNDASFERDVLQSDVPVLVDFWAPWCGPCHMIAPSLEKLAAKYSGQMKVAKLNVDENPNTAYTYQVQGIPMLLMFKGGQPVGKLVGAHPQGNIEQLILQSL